MMAEVEMQPETRANIFWHLVEESLDEAEFLWTRWETFLDSPALSLAKVDFWVEQRLRGALDGVRVAGDAAIEPLLEPALASDTPGRIAAAAYVLASLATPRALTLLTRAIESFAGPSLDAVRRGAERCDNARVLPSLVPLLRTGSSQAQAAVLDIHVARGVDAGAAGVTALLASADPLVRAAALRAARFCPSISTEQLAFALDAAEPEVAVAAIETSLWRGSADAWEVCLRSLTPSAAAVPYRSLAPVLAMSGSARAERRLYQLLDCEPLQRDLAFALSYSGRVEAAEACLTLMRAKHVVKLAADAFCFITGLDLGAMGLVAPEPEPPTAPDSDEDDLDANLVPSLDDALPMPRVEEVADWWRQHKPKLEPNARYVRGQFCDSRALRQTLAEGPARHRHELARELALRSRGTYRVATRALAHEQRRQLAHAAMLEPQSLTRIADWAPLL